MLGSIHVPPGADLATGVLVLAVFAAGVVLAMLAVFGVVAYRHAGQPGTQGALWRVGLVLVGVVLAWVLIDRPSVREQAADRRAIEARSAELTARAIAPGSPLACLDAVASVVVEIACEKALFATPESVAAAVAYVDARFSLLAPSIALAESDPSMQPSLERLRRAIEADRFGLVAHVLMTRGCNTSDCADLKLVRDGSRILANMKARSFEARVGMRALAWHPNGMPVNAAAASSSPPPMTAVNAASTMPEAPPHTAGSPAPGRFDYPSSDSIPAISIMNAEPGSAPEAGPRVAPARRPPPPRRQTTAREALPPASSAPPIPQAAPPVQTSGSR